MKSSSRRIAQRRNKRNLNLAGSKLLAEQQLKLEQTLRATKHRCLHQYGCFADPKYSLQKNFNIQISRDEPTANTQPKNLGFHNLCSANKLPLGTKQLLGLNLNFCLAPASPRGKTVLKMARSIRIKYFLDQHGLSNDEEYNRQIYINNTCWHPTPAPLHIENHITNFEKALKLKQKEVISKNKNRLLPNLTPLKLSALRKLQSNSKIIIKPTDKNLGPAVLDTEAYVEQVLQEHLNTKHYQLLSDTESRNRYEAFKSALKDLITTNIDCLSKAEALYFQRSFKLRHRLPIFYGLPKVHKSPISLRPVVSSVNSFSSVFSNWLDFKMKDLLPFIKSYTKNSFEVLEDLKTLDIPNNALLFSADAKSMYTNIDTTVGIQSFRDFFTSHETLIPVNFPVNLFLRALELVMSNNIFSFGNTTWLQLSGTAMGTPAACSYATITYGQYENAVILPEFDTQLLYYRRYIDDIFGIWVPPETEKETTWNEFKKRVNQWGTLEWIIQEPSKKTVFLDLNIELRDTKIHSSTFQKALNLYLYIPPTSAHPPSCLKGLISGEMRRYWLQNDPSSFETILKKFIIRLTERGHQLQYLLPLLQQAAKLINNQRIHKENKDNRNTLFIHHRYHPRGLQRKDIRDIYDRTLKPFLNFDAMTVAISRPNNLREILTKTPLKKPTSLDIPRLIKDMKSHGSENDYL
jgi:hypothetical protein